MDYFSTVVSLNKDLFSIFSVRDNILLKGVIYSRCIHENLHAKFPNLIHSELLPEIHLIFVCLFVCVLRPIDSEVI